MTDLFAPVAMSPDRIGPLEIVLRIEAGTPNKYEGRCTFDILDADGAIVSVRSGDLVPCLTAGQIAAIKVFMDSMLTKAQGVVA